MLSSFRSTPFFCFFFFNDTATTEIYTLSLHDALPIWGSTCWITRCPWICRTVGTASRGAPCSPMRFPLSGRSRDRDRKSTRLNSSHLVISYAVFCLKKKKINLHNKLLITHTLRL